MVGLGVFDNVIGGTQPTERPVGIVRWRTKAPEFFLSVGPQGSKR
jgi:hypothetical protein